MKREQRNKLKALGLPDTLFDADFPQQFEKAKLLHEQLKQRQAEMLATDEWKDVDMLWSADLAEWEASDAIYTPGPELVQVANPMWMGMMSDWAKDNSNEFLPLRKIKHRLKMSWNNPPAPGTKMHRLLVQRGIDPQKLMDQLIAERNAERG